jgi:hypothetical protein
MLSPVSLAAFSSAIPSLHPARGQPVRSTGTEQPAGTPPPTSTAQTASPASPDSATRVPRLLPRGSLLDLSV